MYRCESTTNLFDSGYGPCYCCSPQQRLKNYVHRNLKALSYGTYDNQRSVQSRIARAVKQVKNDQVSKAHRSLKKGCIANLAQNRNWQKVQERFPEEAELAPRAFEKPGPSKWNLTLEAVKKSVFNGMNNKSGGGPNGLSNRTLKWILDREDHFHLGHALSSFAKAMQQRGAEAERLFSCRYMTAKGLPVAKPKDGMVDGASRPIVISNAIPRLIDRIIDANIDPLRRVAAIGRHQLVGQKKSGERCHRACLHIDAMMKDNPELLLQSTDVTNAFNEVGRLQAYKLLLRKLPELANAFLFQWGFHNNVIYDSRRSLLAKTGMFQGMTTSGTVYMTVKNDVIKYADDKCRELHPDYKCFARLSQIDDSIELHHYSHSRCYTEFVEEGYDRYGMRMNQSKFVAAMVNKDPFIQNIIKDQYNESKSINFKGNYSFNGAHHGTPQYISTKLIEDISEGNTVLNHIFAISSHQIRSLLLLQYFKAERWAYKLKMHEPRESWTKCLQSIHQKVLQTITFGLLEPNERTWIQFEIGTKNGGFGLRSPTKYGQASYLVTLASTNEEHVDQYFPYSYDSANYSNYSSNNSECDDDAESDNYNLRMFDDEDESDYRDRGNRNRISNFDRGRRKLTIWSANKAREKSAENIKHKIEYFRSQILSEMHPKTNAFLDERPNQSQVLDALDADALTRFREECDNDIDKERGLRDRARLHSLQTPGALSWTKATPAPWHDAISNPRYRRQMALHLGLPQTLHPGQCLKCGEHSDRYGVHALSCMYGPGRIRRHNKLRDELRTHAQRAGKATKTEDGISELEFRISRADAVPNPTKEQEAETLRLYTKLAGGRPADLRIIQNNNRSDSAKDALCDLSVINPHCKSYLKRSAKEPNYAWRTRENTKFRKYKEMVPLGLVPCVVEVFGGLGKRFDDLLRGLAKDTAARRDSNDADYIHAQMRVKFSSLTMKENTKMILASMPMI